MNMGLLSAVALNSTHGAPLLIIIWPPISPNAKKRRRNRMRAVFPDVAYRGGLHRLSFLPWTLGYCRWSMRPPLIWPLKPLVSTDFKRLPLLICIA